MLIINSQASWSDSCEKYPFNIGVITDGDGDKLKIMSTSDARVILDNISNIEAAKEKATLEAIMTAKARLADYLVQDDGPRVQLRGVVLIDDCYTPLKIVKVTVMISSATIKQAQKADQK